MIPVKHLYIIFFFLLFPLCQLLTQHEEREFDQKKLEALWEGDGFDQTKKEEKIPYYGSEPMLDTQGLDRKIQDRMDAGFVDGKFVLLLMYTLAGILLLVIIFAVVKNTIGTSGRILKTDGIPELAQGNIQALDTQSLIARAVANQDYRLAIRLNYLDILKKLDRKNLIKWRANKTNQDYVNELSNHPQLSPFKLLTYHFDYAWYGDFMIEEKLYKNLEAQFQQFQLKLRGSR